MLQIEKYGAVDIGSNAMRLLINNIIEVNGQTLFSDRNDPTNSNLDLLSASSYTLNMATLADNEIIPNGKEVELSKSVLQINPIFIEDIIETNGRKIGYLMYNRFLDEFDGELNEVFGRFQAEGITDLVLDFRYNPGGSVLTAQRIASMVYDDNPETIFSTSVSNEKYKKVVYSANNPNGERYFQDRIVITDQEKNELYNDALKTLNLDKVYIIALYSSASASELVINSLAPYMDVIHVGDTTRGKNEFSNTFVDAPSNGYFYHPSIVDKINPDNSWAIQPLTGRSANADGFFEYTEGLYPDVVLEEDLGDLGVLGEPNERLLARAIQEITGASAKRDFSAKNPINEFTNNNMFLPTKDNMYEGDVLLPTPIE